MTRGYLLDTNIIRYWYDEGAGPEHTCVVDHVNALESTDLVRTSAIVWGEIEFGLRAASPDGNSRILKAYKEFVAQGISIIYDVGKATTLYYGPLRARLFEKFADRK